MPKALCMIGLVISILIFVLFLVDLVIPSIVFHRASMAMDIIFIICAAILGFMSWVTWRDQP